KSIKMPGNDKEYQCISVVLGIDRLRQYALDNGIGCAERYTGKRNIILQSDGFMEGYFHSILPYVQQWKKVSKKMAEMKVNEAIELVLHQRPDLASFLFDFADPHKEDLEAFMLKNFHYNAPLAH